MKDSFPITHFLSAWIIAAVAIIPASSRAANTTWDGGGGDFNWFNANNWTGDTLPDAAANAKLLDVTAGIREVTIPSGSPLTINQLTITQTTAGASNVLNVNEDFTISGNATPFVITATAGQDSIVTNIEANKTLLATYNGTMTSTFGGTLNLTDGSVFKLQALGATSDLNKTTFGGPINVNGAGAQVVLQAGRWVFDKTSFNGAVTINNPGSTLTVKSMNGSGGINSLSNAVFAGNDGSGNSVNAAAGTQFNVAAGSSTLNFTNRVNLDGVSGEVAAATMTLGASGGSGLFTSNFNGGLVMGEGAKTTIANESVTTTMGRTSSMATGSELLLQYTGPQGAVTLSNSGNFTVDGGAIKFDWAASSPNNGTRNYTNTSTGTWTMKNGATLSFISSTGRPLGGFGVGTNSSNAGIFNVESGASVAFQTLYNTGTMNLGSSTDGWSDARVYLGSPANTINSVKLTNGTTTVGAAAAGEINIKGDAWLGAAAGTSGSTTLNNGSATSTGSVINVGDGNAPATFTVAEANAGVNNFAGNTLNIHTNASMLLSSNFAAGNSPGSVTLTNSGTVTQSGTLAMQGYFYGSRTVTTTAGGVFQISGRDATLEALAARGTINTSNVAAVTFSVAGRLSGATLLDNFTYTNSTGNSANNILNMTVSGGEITPGNGSYGSDATSIGSLGLVNTNVTLSNQSKMTFDIGGTPVSRLFDSLALIDMGGTMNLGTDSILDIVLVNAYKQGSEDQTYWIIRGNSVTGTFGTLLFNGSAVTDEYTVNYSADGVGITLAAAPVPEPGTYAMILGGMGCLGVWQRLRRRSA